MRTRLFLVPLAALVAAVPGCRSGLFEGDGSKWRADDAQLKRIDAMDHAEVAKVVADMAYIPEEMKQEVRKAIGE